MKILEKEKTTNIQLKEIIVSNYILSVLFALESKSPIITTISTMVNKVCLWSSDLPKKELKKIHSEPFRLVLQNGLNDFLGPLLLTEFKRKVHLKEERR